MYETTRIAAIAAIAACASATASAQAVLFDFNNAPLHAPLPIDVTAGGITAHLSATGQGYSIQDSSAPVVPVGFTGRFVYPSSVFLADLLVSFDLTLTDFSILYSPQELGCDDSATMRVTATMNGTFVGTATHTASDPGTWPVDTLSCHFAQGFDAVVVHYDHRPPTCTDWGPIFLADDMRVTPAGPPPSTLCFGDGSATACPCGNQGSADNGCANSITLAGAHLAGSGASSVTSDTFVLTGSGMPDSSVLYFQGTAPVNGGMGSTFGDGLRCAAGAVVRLGTKFNSSSGSSYPAPGDSPISIRGLIPAAGGLRFYQAWYRNNAGPCGSGFNLTNAVQVTWMP